MVDLYFKGFFGTKCWNILKETLANDILAVNPLLFPFDFLVDIIGELGMVWYFRKDVFPKLNKAKEIGNFREFLDLLDMSLEKELVDLEKFEVNSRSCSKTIDLFERKKFFISLIKDWQISSKQIRGRMLKNEAMF